MTTETQNEFIASGGAGAAGFACDGNGYPQGAIISGELLGVWGTCTGAVGNGVQGNGAGGWSGVAGFGAPTGTGVFGQGGGTAPGVRGIGGGGTNTSPPPLNAVGVYGQGGAGNSDGVQGVANGNYSGVAGFGGPNNGIGVFAQGGATGGSPIVAQFPPNAPVSQMRGQIHLVPVPLTEDPNSAGLPGLPGDLLAVDINGTVQLWFNQSGKGGWTVVL
jgi:hypothetical protein